jgi:DNA-binding transcriptional LysR family regulator
MTEASWDLFRLFSVVARTGSVNRAAHELGMSQPTLSRRLKELERYVAAPLFFRASSGVKLTREGEDLQRSAGDMMLAFESFHRDLRSRVGQRSSVVRISATEGMTKHWLLPRVAELRRRDSRIYLEIISGESAELGNERSGLRHQDGRSRRERSHWKAGRGRTDGDFCLRAVPCRTARASVIVRAEGSRHHRPYCRFCLFPQRSAQSETFVGVFLGSGGHPQRCSGQPGC